MNPADAMTKAVDSVTLERLIGVMGLERRSGRAEIAPQMELQELGINAIDVVESDACGDFAETVLPEGPVDGNSDFLFLLFNHA